MKLQKICTTDLNSLSFPVKCRMCFKCSLALKGERSFTFSKFSSARYQLLQNSRYYTLAKWSSLNGSMHGDHPVFIESLDWNRHFHSYRRVQFVKVNSNGWFGFFFFQIHITIHLSIYGIEMNWRPLLSFKQVQLDQLESTACPSRTSRSAAPIWFSFFSSLWISNSLLGLWLCEW